MKTWAVYRNGHYIGDVDAKNKQDARQTALHVYPTIKPEDVLEVFER